MSEIISAPTAIMSEVDHRSRMLRPALHPNHWLFYPVLSDSVDGNCP